MHLGASLRHHHRRVFLRLQQGPTASEISMLDRRAMDRLWAEVLNEKTQLAVSESVLLGLVQRLRVYRPYEADERYRLLSAGIYGRSFRNPSTAHARIRVILLHVCPHLTSSHRHLTQRSNDQLQATTGTEITTKEQSHLVCLTRFAKR